MKYKVHYNVLKKKNTWIFFECDFLQYLRRYSRATRKRLLNAFKLKSNILTALRYGSRLSFPLFVLSTFFKVLLSNCQ